MKGPISRIFAPIERGPLPYWLLRLLGDAYLMRYLTKDKNVLTVIDPDNMPEEGIIELALTQGKPGSLDILCFLATDPNPHLSFKDAIEPRWPNMLFDESHPIMTALPSDPSQCPVVQFLKIAALCDPTPEFLIGTMSRQKDWQRIRSQMKKSTFFLAAAWLEQLECFYFASYTGCIYLARNKAWGGWPPEIKRLID